MSNLISMAQQFSGLPLPDLITAPLNSAAEANASMALTQTKFMLDTCFYKKQIGTTSPPEYNYEPIMINMTITRGVLTPTTTGSPPVTSTEVKQVTTNINLPLLTIIPINSLAVDNVDISFEMEVKSSYGEERSKTTTEKTSKGGSIEAKFGWGPLSVAVKGHLSYDKEDQSKFSSHYQKSNSAKYTIKVHAGQLPVPKGVNTIIEAYTRAIEPVKMPTEVTATA